MKLCLGTVQFGMEYGVQRAGKPSLTKALEMLEIAVVNGITAFDTASAYGGAEVVIGEFLERNTAIRSKIELTSKLSPKALDNHQKEHYNEAIRVDLIHSLKKLKTNYLDNYLLHNSAHIDDSAAINALQRVKQEGLVRNIGASVYTPDEAKRGIERGLDILQIPFSIFDRRMDEHGILSLAFNNNVKIQCRSIFTQGLMLMDEKDIPQHLNKARPVVRQLTDFCKDHQISRIQLAIAFVKMQTGISHIVFGVDNREQLFEIIEAYEQSIASDLLFEASKTFSNLDENIIMPSKWKE